MGQIVKRKKKGRPSKADLAERQQLNRNSAGKTDDSDIRRSLRRRSAKHGSIIDYDDYLDFYEETELSIEKNINLNSISNSVSGGHNKKKRRRVKLVVKIPVEEDEEDDEERVGSESIRHSEDEEAGMDDNRNVRSNDYNEEKRPREESNGQDSGPGTPFDSRAEYPMPDKKSLELILDKLQKKDIYGVYADPVDPEELPDYHEIIKNPMDFATVRKKLGDGVYMSLEQLENDVLLICSNAMQYNSPDTVYYKQARTIQELAKRKFQKVRSKIDRSERDLKSDLRMKPHSFPKKQIRKLLGQTVHDPVGSDFSSGAVLATVGEFHNGTNPTQNGMVERLTTVDEVIERNSSVVDNIAEKVEELASGKGTPSKIGKKPIVQDENSRTTYNTSNQPVFGSDSIFSTFENEHKQLVSVGLHAENAYARSLARFAASLGPIAWKVASRRIEQALPPNSKYGRGWVGEYEPLPTPILLLENPVENLAGFSQNLQQSTDVRNNFGSRNTPVSFRENSSNVPILKAKQSPFISTDGHSDNGKTPICSIESMPTTIVNNVYQQQSSLFRNQSVPEFKHARQAQLNFSPSTNQVYRNIPATEKSKGVPATSIRAASLVHSTSFKQPVSGGNGSGGLSNGKVNNHNTSDDIPNQIPTSAAYLSHAHEQGLSIPLQAIKKTTAMVPNQQMSPRNTVVDSSIYFTQVHERGPTNAFQLMRTSTEKPQHKQASPRYSSSDSSHVQPSVPSAEDSINAAQTAARAWMSIGAGGFNKQTAETSIPRGHQISADSLYNPAREYHPQISRFHGENPVSAGLHFQAEKNSFPVQGSVQQHSSMGNLVQPHNGPVVFPQLVSSDLSRFQMQPPRQSFSPEPQLRKKQEMLPPDLNIGFQLSGSPARQSSGVVVDPQQPDLALQL